MTHIKNWEEADNLLFETRDKVLSFFYTILLFSLLLITFFFGVKFTTEGNLTTGYFNFLISVIVLTYILDMTSKGLRSLKVLNELYTTNQAFEFQMWKTFEENQITKDKLKKLDKKGRLR